MNSSEKPEPKDLTWCSLPHCPWTINGHDWILLPPVPGGSDQWEREGYCSQFHAKMMDGWLGNLPHTLVLESDPRDNWEDRIQLGLPGGRDEEWGPDGKRRKVEDGSK